MYPDDSDSELEASNIQYHAEESQYCPLPKDKWNLCEEKKIFFLTWTDAILPEIF